MSRKKIIVLGSTGMAGHVITTFFEEKKVYDVSNLAHTKKLNEKSCLMDVSDFTRFEALLDRQDYDVIINCIGILNQYADASKGKAILLNSYLPHFLEEKYRKTRTKIIHLSTDCVFSGKAGAYTETAFRDGDSSYDRTKAMGEIASERNLTIRTSIIGPDMNDNGIGLFHWFMKSEGEINGYANSIWTGITTIELAKAMERMILLDITGIYHLVPRKGINKYELLSLFQDVFNRSKVNIHKYDNPRIDKSLVNTRSDFDYEVPDYPPMVSEMKEWMQNHRSFYPHYDL
ncbi:MAG: sugar nucleotide-binding protein [Ruminiclostridium sp.]|nr:sugar nucleotide-binding protein [Ruminiclostridium sp.]